MTGSRRFAPTELLRCSLVLTAASVASASGAVAQSADVSRAGVTCGADVDVVRGVVRDRATGRPVPGARVELAGEGVVASGDRDSLRRVRADSAGGFGLCGLAGAGTVSARARVGGDAGPIVSVTAADTSLVLPVEMGAPGRIAGTVVDEGSAEPLAGASVELPGLSVLTTTGPRGRFVVDRLPAVRLDLRIRHLGHVELRDTVRVRPASSVHLLVELPVDAVEVEPIEVTVEDVRPRWLEQSGFYRRRDDNPGGWFVTGEELREKGLRRLSDYFRRLPGVRFNADGEPVTGRRAISSATDGQCGVQYIVNGQPSLSGLDIDAYSPEEIAALELYRGGAQLPPRFNVRRASACGVLVIWTRRH